MKLTEHITDTCHFFKDEEGRTQGEYISWYDEDKQQCSCHCFYKDGKAHGEYLSLYFDGNIASHLIIVNGIGTSECPDNLTEEDKFEICLKYGHMKFLTNNWNT